MEVDEVTFNTLEEIKEFVRQANRASGEVDVCLGSRIVDGKSLLGVLSLGTGKKLKVVRH